MVAVISNHVVHACIIHIWFICSYGPWTDQRLLVGLVLMVNTFRPKQNDCYFAYETFKCIFVNENVWISIKISLKFIPNSIPELPQIMAWCRQGTKGKPLSEPTMVSLSTHICVNRPHWIKLIMVGVIDIDSENDYLPTKHTKHCAGNVFSHHVMHAVIVN